MVPVTVTANAAFPIKNTHSNVSDIKSVQRWRRSSHSNSNERETSDSKMSALIGKSIYATYGIVHRLSYLFLCLLVLQIQFASTNGYSTRQDATPDTKACCRSKGVSEFCLEKMCDTSRPPDEFDVFEVANECTRSLSSIATCLSDGRNHTRCCRSNAKGSDDLCMHLCDGQSYYFNISMWDEYKGYVACLTFNVQSMFTCFERGYTIGPGPPTRLEVLRTTSTAVRLKWSSPNILPHKVIRYSVYYAITPDSRRFVDWMPIYQRVDTEDDSKFYDLDRLSPDTKYRLYVVARGRGEDAVSLPSEIVEFVTDGVASRVEAYKWKVDSPLNLPTTLICMVNARGGGERENVSVNWYFGRSVRDFDTTPLTSTTQGKYQQTVNRMQEPGILDQGLSSDSANGRIYVASLTINRVSNTDFGVYKCTARTPFGDNSATVELNQSTAIRIPQSPPNVTDCCVKEGVQNKCMTSCQNNVEEPATVSLFQGSAQCGQDFPKILRCAVGSGEQQQQRERGFCCLRRGVPLSCLFLCDSTRPMASSQGDLFSCIQFTPSFLQCLAESKQFLPSPPVDVRVKQASTESVTLEWSQEAITPEVLAYHVFYKKQNDQNWRRITSGNMNAVLPDLNRNVQYTAIVVSSNTAGTSDASRPLYFSTGTRLRDQSISSNGGNNRRRKSRNNVRHNSNNHHHQHIHNHHPRSHQ